LGFALLALIISGSGGCRAICCLHDNLLNAYRARRWQDCGCGERYIDPWHSNPPDCWDPCDDHGYFNGRRWWKSGCDPSGSGCRGYYGNPGNPYGNHDAGPMTGGKVDSMDSGQMQEETVQPTEEIPTPANRRGGQPGPYGPPSNLSPSSPPPRVGRRTRRMPPAEEEPNWDLDQESWKGDAPPSTASYRR